MYHHRGEAAAVSGKGISPQEREDLVFMQMPLVITRRDKKIEPGGRSCWCYVFRETAESYLAMQTDDLYNSLKVNGVQENASVIIWGSRVCCRHSV